MPRGGRRPGSGARKGNTNALKDGANSARLHQLAFALMFHPNRVHLFLVGIELGALPANTRDLDPARAVRILYPAVFDPNHPRFNDIANPSTTELEAKLAARAILKGEAPLTVLDHNHQRPSNTVKDIQTSEAAAPVCNDNPDSDAGESEKNELHQTTAEDR